jgi:hypothetical protein
MNLLTGLVSLIVGILLGITVLVATDAILLGIFVNLGLHGTMLSTISAIVVTGSWLYKKISKFPATNLTSIVTLLAQALILGVAFRVLLDIVLAIFGPPSPELMTWNDQVIIAGGKTTLEGWFLIVRGYIESGFASVILASGVILASKMVHGIKRSRTA